MPEGSEDEQERLGELKSEFERQIKTLEVTRNKSIQLVKIKLIVISLLATGVSIQLKTIGVNSVEAFINFWTRLGGGFLVSSTVLGTWIAVKCPLRRIKALPGTRVSDAPESLYRGKISTLANWNEAGSIRLGLATVIGVSAIPLLVLGIFIGQGDTSVQDFPLFLVIIPLHALLIERYIRAVVRRQKDSIDRSQQYS